MSNLKAFFEIDVPKDLHLIYSPHWLVLMIITQLDLLGDKNMSLQKFLDSKIIEENNVSISSMILLMKKLVHFSKNQAIFTDDHVGMQQMNQKIQMAIANHEDQSRPFYEREMNKIHRQIG